MKFVVVKWLIFENCYNFYLLRCPYKNTLYIGASDLLFDGNDVFISHNIVAVNDIVNIIKNDRSAYEIIRVNNPFLKAFSKTKFAALA